MTPPFLKVKEAAGILRCCEKHICHLIKRRAFEASRISRRWIIEKKSFDNYIEEGRVSRNHLSPPGTI